MDKQIKQGTVLKVLYLEDSTRDFEIISERLIVAGYDLNITHVDNETEYTRQLTEDQFDIVLADFKLPGFDAFGALSIQQQICPEIPFICVSGSIGEELAVELLKKGATDYVLKDRLGRLAFAVQSALVDAEKTKEVKKAAEALQKRANELQMYYELMVGRELKMVELKTEINDLLKKGGNELKYFV